jgi:arsenate reductase
MLTIYTYAGCSTCRKAVAWRRLCNTSGGDYRALKLGDRLGSLGPAGVLALLAANGNLIKRPFLLGPEVALVGFDAELWSRRLAA